MLFTKVVSVFGLIALSQALSIPEAGLNLHRRGTPVKRQAENTCLEANAVQTGSEDTGQDPPVDGQANSATDKANFINFCSGETVTNGLQIQGGSCNGIVMGKIPSTGNMISAIIVSPKPGEDLAADTTFTLSVQLQGLEAGAFTNAQKTYYSAPQDLKGGKIVGHSHVTVQDLGGNLEPTNPPDPNKFVFFKGINDAGNGKGLLSAEVTGGLPAGNYRVCSMTSASNHQPVIMPIAQRGAQDDCQKFTVGAGNGGGNNNNGGNNNAGGNGGGNNNAGGKAAGNAGGKAAGDAGAKDDGKAGAKAAGNAGGKAGGNGGGKAGGNAGGKAGGKAGGAAAAALGGVAAPAVTASGNKDRPFTVNGNTFVDEAAAKQRSCDIQRNGCADAVNGGNKAFTLADCDKQVTACNAA